MVSIPFTKMHGAGNDYVYVDCFRTANLERPADLAIKIADRHKGVGGDGLILICPSDKADARMRMFNADGSEAEMCGNGIRCVAKYLFDHDLVRKEQMRIETKAGTLLLELVVVDGVAQKVRVDMGEPIFAADKIPTTFSRSPVIHQEIEIEGRHFQVNCLSMGNPHCVIFVDELTDDLVLGWGPKIERSQFFPARVNVEFVKVVSPRELIQRTWERGSGETLACGTGASAVCVAGVLTNQSERRVLIHLSGGDLELQWDETNNHVYKTGPAVEVFEGIWRGNW
ncbi:MAG: diaminopimelate epimerase [Pirellulaceae bacterium]